MKCTGMRHTENGDEECPHTEKLEHCRFCGAGPFCKRCVRRHYRQVHKKERLK